MKAFKWILICVAGLIVAFVAALLIIPMFLDVQKFKPEIEKQVSKATGCPFSIGGDLKLSLFPLAGIAFSDLRMGNPPGFQERDFLQIRAFEVKIKLMPLLSRDIQVNRFVVDGLNVSLEKNREGVGNWEALLKPSAKAPPERTGREKGGTAPLGALPIENLAAAEIAVRNGSLLWIDAAKGQRKEIKDLVLELQDVSFDRPIRAMLSAKLEGKPIRIDGRVGPLGREWGKGDIPLDASVRASDELALQIRGTVSDAAAHPRFDLALEIAPFSPRKAAAALGHALPTATSDPAALTQAALKVNLKGDLSGVSLTHGVLDLDQSRITFSATAREFSKPDVMLKMAIDHIDADRYLPPPAAKKTAGNDPGTPAPRKIKIDYEPLRKMALELDVRAGKVKAMGADMQDVVMVLKAREGVFRAEPLGLKAYAGKVAASVDVDVRAASPRTALRIDATGIQARPLLNDLMKKDFLEGNAEAKVALEMAGDDPAEIKKTLSGNGNLRFTDGAIIGIDLPGMVRNVRAAFGGETVAERPKTDFTELLVPFTIRDGRFHTPRTSVASPLLRVVASGDADLVKETLDMRVEPKIVATLKGQQDDRERSGLMVPVLVTGTFSAPKFAPDVKGLLETGIRETLKSPGGIRDVLRGKSGKKDAEPSGQPDSAKDLLRGIFGK